MSGHVYRKYHQVDLSTHKQCTSHISLERHPLTHTIILIWAINSIIDTEYWYFSSELICEMFDKVWANNVIIIKGWQQFTNSVSNFMWKCLYYWKVRVKSYFYIILLKLKPGTVLQEKYYYNMLRQSGLVLVFIFSKPCILNSTFSVMQLVSTCFKCKSIA